MKTLQRKDFIYEKSRPLKRYSLTDEGWEVAKRIRARIVDDEGRGAGPIPPRNGLSEADEFLDLEDDSQDERALDMVVDGFDDSPIERRTAAPFHGLTENMSGAVPENGRRTLSTKQTSCSVPQEKAAPSADVVNLLSSPPPPANDKEPPKQSESASANRPDPFTARPVCPTAAPLPSSKAPSIPSIEPILIPSDAFSLRLTLDTREIRAKNDRDYISHTLTSSHSTPPIVQSLPLGDVAFILHLHSPTFLSTHHGEEPGSEIILLDHLLERKRLDDLIYSIKDGRFHEQKFRLRRSGARSVIYLVEDVALSTEHASKYGDTVRSAIASTQLVEQGWSVVRTRGVDDTIRYLARLTKLLRSIYATKPVYLLPTRHLTSANDFLALLNGLREKYPDRAFGITVPTFAALSGKSDGLTLRDVYLKMLMCTRGVSGEKAIEVQKAWATPRALVEALSADDDGKKRDGDANGGGDGGDDDDSFDDVEKYGNDTSAAATATAAIAVNGGDNGRKRQQTQGKESKESKETLLFRKLGAHPVPRRRIGRELSRKVAAIWGGAG